MKKHQPINKTARAYTLRPQHEESTLKTVALTIIVFAVLLGAMELSGWLSQSIWHITPQIP